MGRKLTTDEFIARARKTHGETYDYTLVEYRRMDVPVSILCQKHGTFKQTPYHHLSGSGCSACGVDRTKEELKITVDEFKIRANSVHKNRYDYSKVVIGKTLREKITIICKVHGEFFQGGYDHLNGHGCTKCRDDACRLSIEEFVQRAKDIHCGFYDYTLVNFKSVVNKVDIICPVHGVFKQQVAGHLHGYGCMKCFSDKLRMQRYDFICRSQALFGNRYDYSLVDYKSVMLPVEIRCSVHGIFTKLPRLHLIGQGCPSCSDYGFSPAKSSFIYLMESESMFKVGITNRDVSCRLTEINRTAPEEFIERFSIKAGGHTVAKAEKMILNKFRLEFSTPEQTFDGSTECFLKQDIDLQLVERMMTHLCKDSHEC